MEFSPKPATMKGVLNEMKLASCELSSLGTASSGNVMVIYYYREENDTAFIGMNTTEATLLTARMKERQVDKLLVTGRSNGIFYPMTQLPQGKTKLASFAWFSHLRPLSKEDTLVWRGKNESEKLKTMNRGAVPLPTLKGLKKE